MNIQTLHHATADLGKIVIDVEGMTCASCVGRVERARNGDGRHAGRPRDVLHANGLRCVPGVAVAGGGGRWTASYINSPFKH